MKPKTCDFASLTPKQRDALGKIAINQDGGINPSTIDVLMRRKLIYAYEEEVGGPLAGSTMTITRYLCPMPVHVAWCEWCTKSLA